MEQEICIDSNIVIDLFNNDTKISSYLDANSESKMRISSVSVFELLLGKDNDKKLEGFLTYIEVLQFDEKCAKKAAEIHKQLRSIGNPIDFRDVFIAATCIVNNTPLVTRNKKDFEKIKGLRVIAI